MLRRLLRVPAPCRRLSDSPLGDVRPGLGIDGRALAAHLLSRGLLLPKESLELRQFSHGQSNPTYLLSTPSRKLVLRKQPPGKLLRGAHAVDREFRAMQALRKTEVPVPNTLFFCEDVSVLGTPFFCYDFVDGRFIQDPALPQISSTSDRREIYTAMIERLACLHAVNVDEIGLSDFGVRRDTDPATVPYVLRQVKTWTKQYRATETEPIADMDFLIQELPSSLPSKAEKLSTLVHGDYRIDNMIFSPTSNDVAAILDWELSTLGDPVADVAYNFIVYFIPPGNSFLRGIKGEVPPGVPSLAEALDIYCKKLSSLSSPVEAPSMADLEYYVAFSFFRICAILQGVYKRSLQGNAAAANAAAALEFAKETAKIGATLLRQHKKSLSEGRVDTGFFPSKRGFHTHRSIPASFEELVSPRAKQLLKKTSEFLEERLAPVEREIWDYMENSPDRWTKVHPLVEELKMQARERGLWNLFMPVETDKGRFGAGLTNVEYAPIAELSGYVSPLAPEILNCNAPDTGNMEVLARYGTPEQQQQWLVPLLDGAIRSCFAMTEPEVASSDATNMRATIERRGDTLILNGHKWWISGAMDPRCKVCIFMGRTSGDLSNTPAHNRHSMVIVPMNSKGIQIKRPMTVMGYADAPHGHADMYFEDVQVPASNFLLGEGRGFEIAQGRLGPGRIHHCMRLVGMAEKALRLMCERVNSRIAFGKPLAEQGIIRENIALSKIEISQARLLCLNAAVSMDRHGNKEAREEIAAIKVVAPRMAKGVIDRAIQAHGGMGLSQDSPLPYLWTCARVLQLADGPDEVHLETLAKYEIKRC